MIFSLILILLSLSIVYSTNAIGKIKVNPLNHLFLDEYNRTITFHGVNAVYKIAPWHPNVDGFDSDNSLSDIDAKNLKSWGFNIVRLGVMWPGVEPERNVYNDTYLDQIEIIVNNLQNENIYVILDFHQDLLHRKYCGEGVPDYVYDLCHQQAIDSNAQTFPNPAVQDIYPVDDNNDPELESCLSVNFAKYYLSDEVSKAFQCLYDNTDSLWDSLAGYWVQIANRFKSYPYVLGYELMNEPWAGDFISDPRNLLPGKTELNYLQPMYEHLHTAIRQVDDEKIIFFEGLTIDYFPSGFTQGPGGSDYDDRQALAYHIYCPLTNPSIKLELLCNAVSDEFYTMRKVDANRIGGGMIMTEFGASKDVRSDLYQLNKNCELADRHLQSWIYWQFKYYNDITTCTPEGESLYDNDGNVVTDKLLVLSRTYPQLVAGSIISYQFHNELVKFSLSFYSLTYLPKLVTSRVSSIYFNRELYYPHGVILSLTTSSGETISSNQIDVTCGKLSDNNMLYLTQNELFDSDIYVVVELTACSLVNIKSCTC